jgi:DNA-binding transcriptional ArsR family regulator
MTLTETGSTQGTDPKPSAYSRAGTSKDTNTETAAKTTPADTRGPDLAALAALLADATRAEFCLALLDGRAWTAGELARHAGVAPSTATEHLNLLTAGGLLAEERQGRHRYVRLAGEEAADLVERLAALAPRRPGPARTLSSANRDRALARGRTCYDHLAGTLGVSIADAMTERGLLSWESGLALTEEGSRWLAGIGIAMPDARHRTRRPPVRSCLDWTERRPHLAGSVGAALCELAFSSGWIRRIGSGRAVALTEAGSRELGAQLGIALEAAPGGHG